MRIAVLFTCLLLVLTTASTLNSKTPDLEQDKVTGRLVFSDGHPSEVLIGGAPGGFSAKADTIYLLGGPGRDDGDFEDSGAPSWDGWTSIDLTVPTETIWNVSDFYCQNLDPGTSGNHAWWCGETFVSCDAGDDPRGYGHKYDEWLDWYGEVTDPGSSVLVTVNALLNYDCEPGYDYLRLKYEAGGSMLVQSTWNGTATGVVVSEAINLSSADYVPHPDTGLPAVHLRWQFISDEAWDQEDCSWANEGAAQIDLIEVIFDQGGTPVMMSYEDNEDPDPADNDWRPILGIGVGDFAKVWPSLNEIDPCAGNSTPVVAFIDDGEVVPGTGGYGCTTWCYGPSGYVVNPEGGLAGTDYHLLNAIISPVMTWPGSAFEGGKLSFDVYRHHYFSMPDYNGVFHFWGVQSTASTNPADLDDAPWVNDTFVHYGGPDWVRQKFDVSGLLVPGCTYVRVRLGVDERGYMWGWEGTDSSPAPYFDNVAFSATAWDGPFVTTREIDILQDNFPAIGTIDYVNLERNSVRVDMANNISMQDELRNDPGDSAVFKVVPPRSGTVLTGNPRMYYKLKPNPLFDSFRDLSSFPIEGYVECDPVYFEGGPVLNKFCFDPPDESWFFPGDVFHWYIEARDNGPAPALTLMPPDTTGFSLFPGDPQYVPLQYPSSFVVRALPSLKSATPGDHPKILFWNDFGDRGGQDEWIGTLTNLGYTEGVDYDLYYTNGPSSGVGNGLGGRATSEQLAGYETILYTCGNLSAYTITDLDYEEDPGDDLGVLDGWLRLGEKNLFLTGDDLVSDLTTTTAGDVFRMNWLGVNLAAGDLNPLIAGQRAPLVEAVPGNPVFTLFQWVADGDCPTYNTFDAVTLTGGAQGLAEFTDPGGNPGAYPYAAATLNVNATYNAKTIYFPYDFMYVESAGGVKLSARELILQDVLTYFGYGTSVPDLLPIAIPPLVTPVTIPHGRTITFTGWTATNPGDGNAGTFTNGYYLSADATITAADVLLASVKVATLSAGEDTSFAAMALTIPSGTIPGAYYLGVLVDNGAAVSERDETNNYVSTSLEVIAGAEVGDWVWWDDNANGIQDPGESGTGHGYIQLFDSGDNLIAWTTSETGPGHYSFVGLLAGDYYLTFQGLADDSLSPWDVGDDQYDSDMNGDLGRTAIFTLTADQVDHSWDCGFYFDGSGVGDDEIPNSYALHSNIPNPFNPSTKISFDLPQAGEVRLTVFDISGRKVQTLFEGESFSPGRHEVVWQGEDDGGRTVAAGVYFYRLEAGEFSETKRMTLVK